MFDINLLPQRYRRRKIKLWMVLPTILLLILLGAAYPAYQSAVLAQADYGESQSSLTLIQTTLEEFQASNQDLSDILTEIQTEVELRDQILASYGGLQVSGEKWSPILNDILQSSPDGIQWLAISREENLIRLEGVAGSYNLLISLADGLEPIGGIQEVEIGSVETFLSEDEVPQPTTTELESVEEPGPQIPYEFVIFVTLGGEVLP